MGVTGSGDVPRAATLEPLSRAAAKASRRQRSTSSRRVCRSAAGAVCVSICCCWNSPSTAPCTPSPATGGGWPSARTISWPDTERGRPFLTSTRSISSSTPMVRATRVPLQTLTETYAAGPGGVPDEPERAQRHTPTVACVPWEARTASAKPLGLACARHVPTRCRCAPARRRRLPSGMNAVVGRCTRVLRASRAFRPVASRVRIADADDPEELRVHLDDRGTAIRTRAHSPRPDARHGAHRARLDHPRDRGALHRQRPRRPDPVPVALLRLPARAGGVRARLRQARRHHRAQARHPLRHRPLPRRLRPVRTRMEHGFAHRHACPAGSRRGGGAAADDDDRRGHLHRRRARQDAGLHRERLGGLGRRRSDAGRDLLAVRLVALDLLRQHPLLPAGRRHAVAQLRRVCRASQAPHRLRGCGRAHRLAHAADPRRARGRPGLGVGILAEHRLLRRRGRPAASSSASSSGGRPSRSCRSRSSRAG